MFDLATPITVLQGERLRQQLAPTLGETLANEPGISSSYFGPNASRPVIRGLDGERIRILSNGVTNLDASGISVDHAVSLEPLLIDRIEVVRGPAAILYGTSAVGGVVNVIDSRIATEANPRGITGAIDTRLGSNDRERAVVGKVDVGLEGGLNLHFDGFGRDTNDLRIPGFARSARLRATTAPPSGDEANGRLPNSAGRSDGGSVGASYTSNAGYLGASLSQVKSLYGTVQEPEVKIRLEQSRLDVAGERRDVGAFEALRFKFGQSSYRHSEEDAGVVGTIFRNRGSDVRVEAVHRPIGPFRGVIGLQSTQFDFEASGDEAFLPKTENHTHAVFLFEETRIDALTLQFGARVDRHRVEAEDNPAFGPAQTRSFTPKSGSVGAIYSFSREYAVALNLSRSERAPNYQELFANGPHLATNAFEIGDRGFGIETSKAVDLSLRKRAGRVTGSVGVYFNRFSNFIALIADQNFVDPDPARNLPGFRFTAVPAEFKGAEASARVLLVERPYRFAVEVKGDLTRAENTTTGEPLPRIPAARFGGGLVFEQAAFTARLDALRVLEQDRVTGGELPTDSYTMLNVTLGYRVKVPLAQLDFFLRGVNLLDEEARNHVSFLKDIAPYGRRGAIAGLRASF
ncbi:MAG: TonB-dependent receptor [Proteobacteria bacterium]|nr:TonB-dependent receptor [Burkholderiales bacterium]